MSAINDDAAAPAAGSEMPSPLPSSAMGTILFPQGLPGFPGITRFALRPAPGGAGDFLLLQCADNSELCLLVLRYTPHLLPLHVHDVDAACARLGIRPEHAAVLLVVTCRHEAGTDGALRPTLYVNLRAPVVLDTFRRLGAQPVLTGAAYPVRHLLQAA